MNLDLYLTKVHRSKFKMINFLESHKYLCSLGVLQKTLMIEGKKKKMN